MKKNFIEIELNRKAGIVNFNANIENRFQAKYMLDYLSSGTFNFPFEVKDDLKVEISYNDGRPKIDNATGKSRDEIRFLIKEGLDIQHRIDYVNTYKLHFKMNYLMLCSIIDKYRWTWPFKRLYYIGRKYRPTREIKKIADEMLSRAFQGEY